MYGKGCDVKNSTARTVMPDEVVTGSHAVVKCLGDCGLYQKWLRSDG